MYSIKRQILIALCPLVLFACAKQDVLEENRNQYQPLEVAPQGEVVSFSLDGDIQTPEEEEDSDFRSVSLHKNLESTVSSWIKYKTGRYKGYLFLQRAGAQSVTKMPIVYDLNVGADGKVKIKALKKDFRLQGQGESFAQGDWYVSGFFSLVPESDKRSIDENTDFLGSSNLSSWITANTTDEDIKIDIPLVAPWTKITINEGDKQYGEALSLQLKPAGVLFRVGIQSNIVEEVEIKGVRMISSSLAFRGTVTPSPLNPKQLTYPNFRPTDPQQALGHSVYEKDFPQSFDLPSGVRLTSGYAYIWGMPKEDYTDDHLTALQWKVRGKIREATKNALGLSDQDLEILNQLSVPQRMIPKKHRDFKSGTTYSMMVNVASELMITEHYQRNNGAHPFSLLEVYNPTLETVNLSDYAVARAVQTGRKYEGRYVLHPDTYTDGNVEGESFDNALIQPIDKRNGADLEARWGKSLTLGRKDMGDNGVYSIRASSNILRTLDKSKFKGLTYTGYERPSDVPTDLPLEPGKTAVIGGGFYVEHAVPEVGSSLSFPDQRFNWQGNGPQAERAYSKGYCQYIIALWSRGVGEYNTVRNDNAPVMNSGDRDGYVLVKRSVSKILRGGQLHNRIIDTGAPILETGGTAEEIFLQMFHGFSGANHYSNAAPSNIHTRTRMEGIVFPSQVFNPRAWAVRYAWVSGGPIRGWTFDIDGSLGTRSFVQPEKGLNWAGKPNADWSSVPAYTRPVKKY